MKHLGEYKSKISFSKHNRVFFFVLILFVGMTIRISYYCLNPILNRDSILYCEIAQKWHETNSSKTALESRVGETPFGYIYVLKKGVDWGIPVETWGRFVGITASLFYLISVYAIGLMLFQGYGAEILLLLASIQPATAQFALTLLRDPLCLAFYTFSILALLKIFSKKNSLWVIAFTISSTLAFFLRYEAFELILLFFLLSGFSLIKNHDLKRFCLSGGICLSGFFLLSIVLLLFLEIPYQKILFDPISKIKSIIPIQF